jgi:hypothetical protein
VSISERLERLDRRVTEALGDVDPRLDGPLRQVKRHADRAVRRAEFERDRLARRRRHSDLYDPGRADEQALSDLRRHGIGVLRDVFTPSAGRSSSCWTRAGPWSLRPTTANVRRSSAATPSGG